MKKISKKEARVKYGIITSGVNSLYSYFLRKDGCVVDNDGDIRFAPKGKKGGVVKISKTKRIKDDWKKGLIKKVGEGMYRPPIGYFVLGITARLLEKVLHNKPIARV